MGFDQDARGYSLDEFSGATDDDMLTAALSFAAAQTYKPTIILPSGRDINFTQTRTMYNGMRVSGPPGIGNEYRNTQRVKVTTPGSGWLSMPSAGTVKDVYIGKLSIEAGSDTCLVKDFPYVSGVPVLWTSVFRDLGLTGFKHVFHGVMDACVFDGYWDVNNGTDTQFKLWGSDCNLWPQGGLIDSPNIPTTGDKAHIWVADMSKTTIGPVFVTGKFNVWPMRIDYGRGLVVSAPRLESQQGNPTWGSQLLITGGAAITVRDPWFFNGMSNPTSTGHTSSSYDKGIVTIKGGNNILIDGAFFSDGDGRQSSSTAAGTPDVYVSGGTKIRIMNVRSSDAPKIVRSSAVAAANVVTDPGVTVTTG
jgi:hypothetical protein